jgi:hypothetical protein
MVSLEARSEHACSNVGSMERQVDIALRTLMAARQANLPRDQQRNIINQCFAASAKLYVADVNRVR